jgi:hypothetical protein
MVGTPIKRARREAKARAEEEARLAALNGNMTLDRRGEPIEFAPPATARIAAPPPRIAPLPATPPLTQLEAAMFTEARTLSLKHMLEFLKQPIESYTPGADKLKMKQLEIAQAVLALGGRIDPSVLRGQQTDELGAMLDAIKAEKPAS